MGRRLRLWLRIKITRDGISDPPYLSGADLALTTSLSICFLTCKVRVIISDPRGAV